ncbi:zinc finger protein 236-like [Xyrichtys novacula]|uniref:Zinc finger protein 236-like n=1 Tax=Xyrichtys novacula TaxID=13765 RepID=A0AAV1HIR8_XYRNO|nr:zinc finger protein 236-like [Xyrichtys novacula]
MPKKRSKSSENRTLRALIDEQLQTAAERIFLMLKERRDAETERLQERLTELITAAVERILIGYRASRAAGGETEVPGESSDTGFIESRSRLDWIQNRTEFWWSSDQVLIKSKTPESESRKRSDRV